MRIIAGEARGRVLKAPSGHGTRPTDARAREVLFDILAGLTPGARVLDLYAGSGAVGLEALSRGAASCLFVEQNAAAANAIRTNLKMCDWSERARVWQSSVRSALHRMDESPEYRGVFDLLFADPPFDAPHEFADLKRRVDILSRLLHNAGDLPEGASQLAVIQHPRRLEFALDAPFTLWKTRRTGNSCLSFFIIGDFISGSCHNE